MDLRGLTLGAQIVPRRQEMGPDHVKKFIEVDIFVVRAHAMWIGAIDIGGDADGPPKPGVRPSQADDGCRLRVAEPGYVALDDLNHLVVGIAPVWLVSTDFPPLGAWMTGSDLVDLR